MRKLFFATLFLLPILLGAQIRKIKHVVLIGCDGFGAYAVPEANIPNIKSLMQDGAWTLKARCVLPSSSAVNWASMIMGAGPTLHGYTEWNSTTPEIPSVIKDQYGLFPTIFSVLRQQRPAATEAVVHSWNGISPLFPHEAVNYIAACDDDDDKAADSAAAIIRNRKPTLTFIHLDGADEAGHEYGHRTAEYYKAVNELDTRIGKIVNAVKAAGIMDETLIIVTADHGGKGKGHGGKSLDEVQIPWIAVGPHVAKNHEIRDVVITYDTAATIAYVLGLKIPQAWRGKPVLEAFEK